MSLLPAATSNAACCAHCGLPVLGSPTPAADDLRFCCIGCRLVYSLRSHGDSPEDAPLSRALLRLGLGVFLAMNVMAFSLSFYGMDLYGPQGDVASLTAADRALADLFRWFLLLLTTAVLLLLGFPLALDAWENLRRGRLVMSALIVLAALAAFTVSLVSVLRGSGPLFFDAACMVLLLVTLGQYLEGALKQRALSLAGSRLADLPAVAALESPDGSTSDVDAADLPLGSIVRVVAGSAFPADGIVIEGHGDVDESSLTGESLPRHVRVDNHVWAGSILRSGYLRLRVRAAGDSRRVAQLSFLLSSLLAAGGGTRAQRIADRVARVFVPAAILLALAAALNAWRLDHDLHEAVARALSVALIACPCALGLTAPLVTWHAAQRLARQGIILTSGPALEAAARVRHVAFDKTGTLTDGRFTLHHITILEPAMSRSHALEIAASLEAAGSHPISRAIRAAASSFPIAADIESLPGLGVRGRVGGSLWTFGRPGTIDSPLSPSALDDSFHNLILWQDHHPVASFALSESPRPEAAAAIESLRAAGLHLSVLTGDSSIPARELCERLAIPASTGLLPDQKQAAIRDLRAALDSPIAFVGDGVNDALALAEADLGIAVAGASDLSRSSGSVILLREGLDQVPRILDAARDARRRILLSLCWALLYNLVGIALAFLGLLSPLFAVCAMIASSLFLIRIAVHESVTDPATFISNSPTAPPAPCTAPA